MAMRRAMERAMRRAMERAKQMAASKMKDLLRAEALEVDSFAEEQIPLLRSKLNAKLQAAMAATKLKGKLAVAGAIGDMADGASPEQALNSMLASLASQLFDVEGLKQEISNKIDAKVAELTAQIQEKIDDATGLEELREKVKSLKAGREKIEMTYNELTEKMQTVSEAFAALFDLISALKPPDELISMF